MTFFMISYSSNLQHNDCFRFTQRHSDQIVIDICIFIIIVITIETMKGQNGAIAI